MNNLLHNIVSIFLVFFIFGSFILVNSNQEKIDFKKNIIDFTNFEDNRNLKKVLSFFDYDSLDYWEYKNIGRADLEELYLNYWDRFEYSKNHIQSISRVDNKEFILKTKYIFRKHLSSRSSSYRLSETKFKFNKFGEITSIINLSLKKIDKQYILDNGLIDDFSYVSNVPQKKNYYNTIFFTILLIFNLIIQFISHNNKDVVNKSPSNLNNQVAQSTKTSVVKPKNSYYKKNNTYSFKEKKLPVNKEILKWEAQDKQREVKKEAARIKRLEREREQIVIQKRQEIERIEKEKIMAAKKAEAEAVRKRQNDLKLEKERLEKEKKLAARREIRRKKRETEVKEKRNLEEEVKVTIVSNTNIKDEDEDTFFDDNLSQYITEITDEIEVDEDEDISEYLTEKYMSKKLKKKFKNK